MATPRLKAPACFGTAYYHLISRVVEKRMHFGDREKARLVADMRRHAGFTMMRVVTYCMMSNHFHILVEAPGRPTPEQIPKLFPDDEALERHLADTLGSKTAKQFAEVRWLAREHGGEIALVKARESIFRRMWDVSMFMKGFKQDFTLWFNGTRERVGTLWEGSFKSVLVEPGQALAAVAAYLDLNPVRANIVDDPADYPWCGYAQAMAGNSLAVEGLGVVTRLCGLEAEEVRKERFAKMEGEGRGSERGQAECDPLPLGAPEILARYRLALYGDAATVETKADGTPGKRGFSREEVVAVIQAGGKVPTSQLIRCKVRHFVDGAVVGSKSFVDKFFQTFRDQFGPRRQDGGRPLRAMPKEGRLFALRDLRKSPVG